MTPLLPLIPISPLETGQFMDSMVMALHQNGISLTEAMASFEKRFIKHVIASCGGNKCAAAREMGMHRNTLDRHIALLNIHTWELDRPGTRRVLRKELYASKERAANLGGDHSRRSALAPVRTAHGPREVNAPDAGLPPASAAFTNSVRKGVRGESSEPSRGGAAHLSQDRKPPRVDSFDRDEVECGGLKA